MKTKTGKRTARFRMQTLENSGDNISLILDEQSVALSFNSPMSLPIPGKELG